MLRNWNHHLFGFFICLLKKAIIKYIILAVFIQKLLHWGLGVTSIAVFFILLNKFFVQLRHLLPPSFFLLNSTHFWSFQTLELPHSFLFYHSSQRRMTGAIVFYTSLGDMWVLGAYNYCKHIRSSIISSFSSNITVRGLWEPGLLIIDTYFLEQF